MTANHESVNINSISYAPVYFVQSHGFTQANTFTITRNDQDEHKPIGDTLRKFYENSGNLENSVFLNNVEETLKPNTLKRESEIQSIKFSNFINSDTICEQKHGKKILLSSTAPLNSNSFAVCSNPNQVINIDRKIIKIDPNSRFLKKQTRVKTLPKIKPKEEIMKPLSVQLLKLGNTYHCLNELNTHQKKIVNQAMKNLKDTENIPLEPAYDPVTKTYFIYKVVSPKDLTVLGGKKVIKEKIYEPKKENLKVEPKKGKLEIKDDCTKTIEPKVTRSGRTIKSPKQCLSEAPTIRKSKRYISVRCIKCGLELANIYTLNKHYEEHIKETTHKSLFQFLLSIIKNSCDEDKANTFIEQLDVFIDNLKLILPCVTKKTDGTEENQCFISENVGRLLGITPGKQNLDMEGINCIKDKDGYCKHNPQKNKQFNMDISKPSQLWLSKHNEEIANIEIETESCARINPIEKWPKFKNQVWKYKKKGGNAKKMRLSSENVDTLIDLGNEQLTALTSNESAISETKSTVPASYQNNLIQDNVNQKELTEPITGNSVKPKFVQAQFHSNHFNIHSSPIKPTPGVYQKFQIASDKISPMYMKLIKPLALFRKDEEECNITKENLLRTYENENTSNVAETCNDINIQFNDTISGLNLDNCQKDKNVNDKNIKNTSQYLNVPVNPVASNSGQSLNNILDTLLEDILDLNDFC